MGTKDRKTQNIHLDSKASKEVYMIVLEWLVRNEIAKSSPMMTS